MMNDANTKLGYTSSTNGGMDISLTSNPFYVHP